MDYLGILLRLFYIAGDIALFHGLLGYRFQGKKGLMAIGVACGAGYVFLPLNTFYMILGFWGHYILLFMAGKFLFENIKGGLVVFVIAARNALGNLMDGIFVVFLLYKRDDITTWNVYAIGLNVFFLICMLLLTWWRRRKGLEIGLNQIKPVYFWICSFMLLVPTISGLIWGGLINEEQIYVRGVVEDGLLSLAIIGLAIAFLCLNLRGKQLKREQILNLQCIKEQTDQYKALHEKQQALRTFRHDLNGHIIAMRKLADEGKLTELCSYLEDWVTLKEESAYISTNHVIGDAIFNHYDSESRKNQINFQVKGGFPEPMKISETDLCIILTNLVGNAYEAAALCDKERYVKIEIARLGEESIHITIVNSVKEKPVLLEGRMETTKEDRDSHGLGIVSAKKALGKYGGELIYEVEEERVVTNILV